MIEEFRQPIVDRSILALINKGVKLELENNLLTSESRKNIANIVLKRLEEQVSYRGKNYSLNSIIQYQARFAAKVFYENEKYKSYRFKW